MPRRLTVFTEPKLAIKRACLWVGKGTRGNALALAEGFDAINVGRQNQPDKLGAVELNLVNARNPGASTTEVLSH